MPLNDNLPVIDDRSHQDIMDEIRVRVARYAPEWRPVWNDLNDSDPGIILAEVFAWLAEMLLFRMNRVPALNYIKFLELIGIELQAAQPALAEVTFAVASSETTAAYIALPTRSQVGATADDGKPLVFETTRPLNVLACGLESLQTYESTLYRDRTQANADGEGFYPFGELPRAGDALLLGLAFPPGHSNEDAFPPLVLDIYFWSAESATGAPLVYQCGSASTQAYASAKLQWEAWDGLQWQPVDLLEDETLALTRGGRMLVRVNAGVNPARAFIGAYQDSQDPANPKPALFWLRVTLVTAQYETVPRLLALRLNTVPVEQAETVQGEVLGGTNGSRNQTWRFENSPVIKGSISINIDEGTDAADTSWQAVDDLFGAGPTDRALAIDYSSGAVVAGDGESGAIPVANPANPDANVVAESYRFGGGSRGNVAAQAINHLLTPVEGIEPGRLENLFAAHGGRDEESLDDAKKRARLTLRARDRAVTPEDFELLAQQAGNVKRAKALPLAHPQFPGVKVPGTVTVIVVPDGESDIDQNNYNPAPTPSEGLLRTVCEYLDARRLLSTEVFVVAPRYVSIAVKAQVVVRDNASPSEVRKKIEKALSLYFLPVAGGDDGGGWPFGGAIRYSRVMQRVFAVAGVDYLPKLVLSVDGVDKPECQDVALSAIAAHALLRLETGGLQIETLTQAEAAR